MIAQAEDFLDALVDQMIRDFSQEGELVRRKSGTIIFRGVEIYYRRARNDMLVLIVNEARFELPLF